MYPARARNPSLPLCWLPRSTTTSAATHSWYFRTSYPLALFEITSYFGSSTPTLSLPKYTPMLK